MEKKVKYISDIIHDELNVESPEISEREALKVCLFFYQSFLRLRIVIKC